MPPTWSVPWRKGSFVLQPLQGLSFFSHLSPLSSTTCHISTLKGELWHQYQLRQAQSSQPRTGCWLPRWPGCPVAAICSNSLDFVPAAQDHLSSTAISDRTQKSHVPRAARLISYPGAATPHDAARLQGPFPWHGYSQGGPHVMPVFPTAALVGFRPLGFLQGGKKRASKVGDQGTPSATATWSSQEG